MTKITNTKISDQYNQQLKLGLLIHIKSLRSSILKFHLIYFTRRSIFFYIWNVWRSWNESRCLLLFKIEWIAGRLNILHILNWNEQKQNSQIYQMPYSIILLMFSSLSKLNGKEAEKAHTRVMNQRVKLKANTVFRNEP